MFAVHQNTHLSQALYPRLSQTPLATAPVITGYKNSHFFDYFPPKYSPFESIFHQNTHLSATKILTFRNRKLRFYRPSSGVSKYIYKIYVILTYNITTSFLNEKIKIPNSEHSIILAKISPKARMQKKLCLNCIIIAF